MCCNQASAEMLRTILPLLCSRLFFHCYAACTPYEQQQCKSCFNSRTKSERGVYEKGMIFRYDTQLGRDRIQLMHIFWKSHSYPFLYSQFEKQIFYMSLKTEFARQFSPIQQNKHYGWIMVKCLKGCFLYGKKQDITIFSGCGHTLNTFLKQCQIFTRPAYQECGFEH